jgi:hypothetical protein
MEKSHIRYEWTKQHTVSHLIHRYLWLTCVSYADKEQSVTVIHRQHADDFVKVGIKLWISERTVTGIFTVEVSLQHTDFHSVSFEYSIYDVLSESFHTKLQIGTARDRFNVKIMKLQGHFQGPGRGPK